MRPRSASVPTGLWVGAAAVALILITVGCGRKEGFGWSGAPIVIISVDTLRADHLPIYGYRQVATPAIDALRKDAVLFENAYTHVPSTLASHASLWTGELPPVHGVRDNYAYTLGPDRETLAAFLAGKGYATGGAVSSAVLEKATGIGRGFDFYDDAVTSGGREERDGAATARALEGWLDTVEERPFFAFLHLFEPHAPYEPPEPHRSRYPLAYDGEIARADEILGGFLAGLKRRGIYDRAFLLFLSDHGEGLGDHGEREHGVFLYREAIRVPLLMKLPGSQRAGEAVTAPVALTDVFPTVCRAVKAEPPPGRPGVALSEHFLDPRPASRRIYGETYYPRLRLGWSELTSLVDERWHYIQAPRSELYDMVADPGEKRDLAPALPPAFRTLRLALAGMARSFELPRETDPERARKLVSLGYLTAQSPQASEKDLPDPKDRIGLLPDTSGLQQLLAKGRESELVAATRDLLTKNPGSLDVWRMMADALERQGKRDEAIAALQEGLRESSRTTAPPLRNIALERLAELLVKAGRSAEALQFAEPAAFQDPAALNAIGVAYADAGRLEESRRAFERALELDPADPLARVNLGTALLRAGDLPGARALLEEAVRRAPSSATTWTTLATVRQRLGDEAGATNAWRRAVDLDPEQYDALFNLGVAEGRRGDLVAAQRALRRFIAHAPSARYARELGQARRLLLGIAQPEPSTP